MPDVWFSKAHRVAMRRFRIRTRITPFEIIHTVIPASGAGETESFIAFQTGANYSFLRSGALGETPGRSRDLGMPGGATMSGRIRAVFDGLGTGGDGNATRGLITGADGMYTNHKGVKVTFKVHNMRYQLTDVYLVDWTDEIVVDARAEEIDR